MWIITAWQHISPKVTVKGFKKCCISTVMDGQVMICCGMAVKRMGMHLGKYGIYLNAR